MLTIIFSSIDFFFFPDRLSAIFKLIKTFSKSIYSVFSLSGSISQFIKLLKIFEFLYSSLFLFFFGWQPNQTFQKLNKNCCFIFKCPMQNYGENIISLLYISLSYHVIQVAKPFCNLMGLDGSGSRVLFYLLIRSKDPCQIKPEIYYHMGSILIYLEQRV